MNAASKPPPPRQGHARRQHFSPRRLLRHALLLALFCQCSACTSFYMLKQADRSRVMAGETSLVLMRLDCRVDGQFNEPFHFSVPMDNFTFGAGSFKTVGEPVFTRNGFLSEASRKEGWTYLMLPAGTHYMTVRPPQRGNVIAYDEMLKSGPRWRVDVPAQTRLLYVGTLCLQGEADGLIFGGRIMHSINEQDMSVRNEQQRAAHLLEQCFPEAGPMTTRLMQRWQKGEPIIIRSTPP